jgi:hypothetical protein
MTHQPTLPPVGRRRSGYGAPDEPQAPIAGQADPRDDDETPTDRADSGAASPAEIRYDVSDLLAGIGQPLAASASAEEVATEAARHHQAADDAADRAERDQAEYDALMDAAREEAARIIAEAETRARPLAESAGAAGRAAAALRETARRLDTTAGYAAKAEAAEAAVQALEDEQAELDGEVTELGKLCGPLEAERQDLEARLATATEAINLDEMTSLQGRLDSVRSALARLSAKQSHLQARLSAIGNGHMLPTWPQLELAEARRQAGMARRTTVEALNFAQPESPSAAAARRRQHERQLASYAAGQRATERQAAQRQPQQQIVRL